MPLIFERKDLVPVVLPVCAMATLGQQFSQWLQYDRAAILQGELWRLLSGHFAHLDGSHLLLNLAGAVFILGLFGSLYRPLHWVLGILGCALGISLSFLFLIPALDWYRGLSGVLHGLLVMGLVGELRRGKRGYALGLGALAVKLFAEQFWGLSGVSHPVLGFRVITSAHLLGALWGFMFACRLPVQQAHPERRLGMAGGDQSLPLRD